MGIPASPDGLTVVALGVGGAFSRRHYSTALAVGHAGRWLLVDCPHPMRRMLGDASTASGIELDVGDFDGIVLTHLHADHCSGLESVGFYARYHLGRNMALYAHPAISTKLWPEHLAAGMEQPLVPWWTADPECSHCVEERPEERELHTLADYFDLTQLDTGAAVQVGPFTVECRRTLHVVDTTAVRISAGGATFAYSADTAYDQGLIDWLAEGDLIAHECGPGIHTPYECLAKLPEDIRSRMVLVHYDDSLDADASVIRCLNEGDVVEVRGR